MSMKTKRAIVALGILCSFDGTPAVAGDVFLRPLRVVDAGGKLIGRYDGSHGVFMKINSRQVVVLLDTVSSSDARLTWYGSASLPQGMYFKSSDCSGAAYVPPSNLGLLPAQGFGTVQAIQVKQSGKNAQIYLGRGLVAKVDGPFLSGTDYRGACVTVDMQPTLVFALDAPIDIAPEFELPLRLE